MLNESEFYQNALLSVLPVLTKKYLDQKGHQIGDLGPDGEYNYACAISSLAISIALRCARCSTFEEGEAYAEVE